MNRGVFGWLPMKRSRAVWKVTVGERLKWKRKRNECQNGIDAVQNRVLALSCYNSCINSGRM